MTGIQIKEAAESYVDDQISNSDAVLAINEGLAWISDLALVYDYVTLNDVEQGTLYDLPKTMTFVKEVIYNDKYQYRNYSVLGSKIKFNDSGKFTVAFRRQPKRITNISETLEVHELFQNSLVTYLRAWYKLMDDDENPDGHKLLQKFEMDTTRAFNILRRNKKNMATQVRVIR